MLVPLVVRSCYSLLNGVVAPAALVAKAKDAGLARLGLSDRNGLYGIPTFVEACRKDGISPILGLELVCGDGRSILIPRTKTGFSRLTRLLTARAARPGSFDVRAAILGALGGAARDELFVLSDDEDLLGRAEPCASLFALVTQCNRPKWGRLAAAGHRPAASPEVSFLEADQRETQRLLLAIGRKRTVHDIGDEALDPPEALWSQTCLAHPWPAEPSLLPWLGEAFAANGLIEREALGEPFSGFVFPRFEAGRKSGSDAAAREADPGFSAREAPASSSSSILRSHVLEGAAKRYPAITDEVKARIDRELALIESKGFSDYFLVVEGIVKQASRICGRGSAAASIVSYCLGITEVDPLRHSLYFERFLNPGRKDPPDIDVDFAWDERDDLLAKVVGAYGPEHTARVANHICFRQRSALRETARAFGMPDAEISAFERSLKADREGALAAADSAWKSIAALAAGIVGLPRHLGAHSGGLVIVPDGLADHVPVEETGNGIRVIAWDKDGAEEAGLVKIDLLGNRSLAVVRDAVANIGENNLSFDPGHWRPIDDRATVDLLARGDTMGVFYVESPAMRLLQIKTGRGDFEHLVIHSSIIRPAANKYINEYVDRLNGKPWEPLHPLLADLFNESFGIMCYQEDVSKAAIALAGFSSSEADGIRKILSKKDVETRLQEYSKEFFRGARGKGVDEETIKAVWEMICSFSGYSFVKAHSASYAMLSFQSAFLRAHYPAEFMAAVLSNHGGFYSTLAYASESRRMGLSLLPPDVNESEMRCRGRNGTVRFGFCMVSSLNADTAEGILRERGLRGPFASVGDFARRLRFERTDAEALIGSGAFDALATDRPASGGGRAGALMTLLSICAAREESPDVSRGLFPADEEDEGLRRQTADSRGGSVPEPPRGQSGPTSPRKRCEAELKYLGTTLAIHPLALWPGAFGQARTRAADLRNNVGRRLRLLGWPITAKPVLTAGEEAMEFVSFEDETAIFETVLFPEAYEKYRHFLFEARPLWVEGTVEYDRGAVTLTIESLSRA